jgi:excinuclease ABC subunit A
MKNRVVEIQGARVHNLKNVHVTFPQRALVVFTGVSGSGKSSLAFDTLYAEGQRRYVESLSAYVRQFMGRLDKPDVDDIKGLSPAVAIEQKVASRNPRSTVGTATEIYDYLKVLFARIGRTYSPITGAEVRRHTPMDVVQAVESGVPGDRLLLTCPLPTGDRPLEVAAPLLLQQGYARLWTPNGVCALDDFEAWAGTSWEDARLVVDRLVAGPLDEEAQSRVAESAQIAFFEGHGTAFLVHPNGSQTAFSSRFEADGQTFEEPTPNLFAFNNPVGACPTCEGFGSVLGIDPLLVIPNTQLSVYEDCVAPWKGERMGEWKDQLLLGAPKVNFPVHRPYRDLTDAERTLLWKGCAHFQGINAFFAYVESKSYKIQYRVLQARYRGRTVCSSCGGSRLKPETYHVKINGTSLPELLQWPLDRVQQWFVSLVLSNSDQKLAERLLQEVRQRLGYLVNVGLPYLTLARASATLSGGESQRIQLATGLGSALVGSLYILDEPSIGLHPQDSEKLLSVVQALRDAGNTVVVVEHDDLFMERADWLVDLGPNAGSLGGEVVYSGPPAGVISAARSLTGDYLTGRRVVQRPNRREPSGFLNLTGARENNLKNVSVELPLGCLLVVAGVSGSGKSTLIRKIAVPAVERKLTGFGDKPGQFDAIDGDFQQIHSIEFIDQNPIGKSSRSNPVTYLKAYDDIRNLYASQKLAELRGFKPKHFSFNTEGGRCEVCKGDGRLTIEMQFMADVHLECEACGGKRFVDDVLEVEFHGKNINDILTMTVDDARAFFYDNGQPKIAAKLQPLVEVGLGYVQLGQPSSTLSGGEAQRVKLASFLARGATAEKGLFVFDEPTTGLHLDDVQKLLVAMDRLLELGHSIWVVEHHPAFMEQADWLLELGPVGGDQGGELLYSGPPAGILQATHSPTGAFLRKRRAKNEKGAGTKKFNKQ